MLIGTHLESILKNQPGKGVTFYADIVIAFDLPPLDGHWLGHPLAKEFEALDLEDTKLHRPFRTSAVVGQTSYIPGDGFFEALRRFKGIKVNNAADRDSVWLAEWNAARAYPWP